MEPLSATASVIAVVTLAWQSSKAAYELVDGISEAPKVIAHSKTIFLGTKDTLTSLKEALETRSHDTGSLDPVLRMTNLEVAVKSVQGVCDDFDETVKSALRHSVDGNLSKRDRISVTFNESKFANLNRRLGECRQTISLAMESIILITSCDTSEGVKQLGDKFLLQERALGNLQTQLQNAEAGLRSMTLQSPNTAEEEAQLRSERVQDRQLLTTLQSVCQGALSATRSKRMGQTFGEAEADDSQVFQGTVGAAQDGLEQMFGKIKATNQSKVIQGQVDASSFAIMFGR